MLKKVLCSFLSFIFIPLVFAGGPEVASVGSQFDGFYGGFSGGYTQASFHYRYLDRLLLGGGVDSYEDTNYLHVGVGFAALDAGYGHVFDWFYFGINVEGSLGRPHRELKSYYNVGVLYAFFNRMHMSVNNYSGLTARIGFLLTPKVLLFIPVGLAFSNVAVNFYYKTTILGVVDITNNFHQGRLGFRTGVGVEGKVNSHWSVLASYLYTTYSGISGQAVNRNPTGDPFLSTTAHLTVHTNRFLLGLAYYFGA